MFLVNSLNDKLKRTMVEMDASKTQSCDFPFEKKPKNKAIISKLKEEREPEFTSHQLSSMKPNEWEKTFTLPRLREKWDAKLKINFNLNHKKFPEELVSPQAKESRQFVREFVDPDILGRRTKWWNNSSNPKAANYFDIQKNLFEVTQGLNNFQIVPLNEHKVEEGCDSRNYSFIDGNKWEISTKIEDSEKRELSETSRKKAETNTTNYWRRHENERLIGAPLEISESRKKIEPIRYYQTYRNPSEDAKFRYTTMQKAKESTWFEREKVYKKILKDNPLTVACQEKINSLVDKQMSRLYKTKYDELSGKKRISPSTNIRTEWKDEEIVDKIQTLGKWKNIKWFHPISTETDDNGGTGYYHTIYHKTKSEDKDTLKRELLKPLVESKSKILKEEEKIKQTLFEAYKAKIKKETLQQKNKKLTGHDTEENKNKKKYSSIYPLDKASFEEQQRRLSGSYDELQKEEVYNSVPTEGDIISPTENKSNKKFFLDAYKKVAIQGIKEQRKKLKKESCYEYQFKHLGTYVRNYF
ncbi:MAG: hypothetical protein MJ252_12335 [archaeon]|nr:hypothetical protein [archaeon]